MPDNTIRGRFAPSPSGRLHLGNVLTVLLTLFSLFYLVAFALRWQVW